ncbi:CAAX prenyl protease 2 isoform X4 [Vidua chalybeata]|uniref:CAAX prenyl protease 2 isoform X4 n=1 Tax=Vidua chalybeata TaxID=81927 RepID=UPI0023A7A2D2|nr:CAAX prenyl protease 2 isoform X4 [Vidua chalybeata]
MGWGHPQTGPSSLGGVGPPDLPPLPPGGRGGFWGPPPVPPQICHPPPLSPTRGSLWQFLHRTSLVHPEVEFHFCASIDGNVTSRRLSPEPPWAQAGTRLRVQSRHFTGPPCSRLRPSPGLPLPLPVPPPLAAAGFGGDLELLPVSALGPPGTPPGHGPPLCRVQLYLFDPAGVPVPPPAPPTLQDPSLLGDWGGFGLAVTPLNPKNPRTPEAAVRMRKSRCPPMSPLGCAGTPPRGTGTPKLPPRGTPKPSWFSSSCGTGTPLGGTMQGRAGCSWPSWSPRCASAAPRWPGGSGPSCTPSWGGCAASTRCRTRRRWRRPRAADGPRCRAGRGRPAGAPPKSSAGGGGRRRRRRKGPGATSARDHPAVIKRRFTSVLVVSGLSPALVWLWKELTGVKADTPLPALLGLRLEGLLPATLLPLLLTMILFLGPLIQLSMDCPWRWLDGIRVALDPRVWALCLGDVRWLRNQVVAPLTEELVFRACMLPMLVPCTGPGPAVLACPLFFGVAHFHHVIEQLRFRHGSVGSIFMAAAFQFSYTAVFGAYTAFLFLRTGHLAGPVLCHSFCNSMGFPALGAALGHPRRRALLPAYLLGVLGFLLLLHPLTEPAFFGARPPCRDPPACS